MTQNSNFDPRCSYDCIADIYDYDMGQNLSYDDIRYYVERALEKPESILELGCGTGRITLPLLRRGLSVTAVDISSGMLSAFQDKLRYEATSTRQRLRLVRMD